MRNVESKYGSIDYRLLEIGMLGSHGSINSSTSDIDSLHSCYFLGNSQQLMMARNFKYMSVEDIQTQSTCEDKTTSFHGHIFLSDSGNEDDVIMEKFVNEEWVNMATLHDLPNPYFYIPLPVIQDLRVLITFTLFEAEVLPPTNVTPS